MTIAALPAGVRLFVAGDLSGIGVTMFNLATNKSDAPPVASAGDSERANQPRPEVPYKPYAELELPQAPMNLTRRGRDLRLLISRTPRSPQRQRPPYEPYKGI